MGPLASRSYSGHFILLNLCVIHPAVLLYVQLRSHLPVPQFLSIPIVFVFFTCHNIVRRYHPNSVDLRECQRTGTSQPQGVAPPSTDAEPKTRAWPESRSPRPTQHIQCISSTLIGDYCHPAHILWPHVHVHDIILDPSDVHHHWHMRACGRHAGVLRVRDVWCKMQ